MYSIFEIAEWFLNKENMTHKKLQKLCYYAYAWYYALKSKTLCHDTRFEAWVHGPVSHPLYRYFAGNGWDELLPSDNTPFIDSQTTEVLESVWETYGSLTGNALEALTHQEPPWQKARLGLLANAPSREPIKESDMMDYYLSIYEGSEE